MTKLHRIEDMANSYFWNVCDEPESVLRYRYCSFKARHSKGSTKARWEYEAGLAMEDAMAEKLQKEATTKNRNCFDEVRTPGGLTDKISFYRVNDNSGLNLRVLSRKTLPEINEAIKYWEDHLGQMDLSNLAKNVLRFQLRKLKTVRAIMRERTTTK